MRYLAGAALVLLAVLAPAPASAQMPATHRGLWTCSLDNIGATLTQCQAVPTTVGLRYYLTTLVAQSTTSTGGQFLIRTGTGTNCGTGTASLLPAAATAARLAAPANTVIPLNVNFAAPLVAPIDAAICVLGVATNTTTVTITGYLNP